MQLWTRVLGFGLASLLSSAALADSATFDNAADATSTVVTVDGTLESSSWHLLIDNAFTVGYGMTFTPVYDFGRGTSMDALRTRLFQFPGEVCGATIVAVDLAFSPTQVFGTRYIPDFNGEIALPNATVYKAQFVLNQPLFGGGRCVLRSEGLGSDGRVDPIDPPDFQLAGVIHYQGGFRNQQPVSIFSSEMIKAIWVRVPAFCQSLDVLEAGVVTEGFYDRARLVDAQNKVFQVNGGFGTRASAINVSFNGPTTLSCDIPVYYQTIQ